MTNGNGNGNGNGNRRVINAALFQNVRLNRAPQNQARQNAVQQFQGIPGLCQQGLRATPRDWIALECLANEQMYAKPDTRKRFLIWEALKTNDTRVRIGDGAKIEHGALIRFFVTGDRIRFPFNPGDSDPQHSISPTLIRNNLRVQGTVREMPRWSTASRSSVALVPLVRPEALAQWNQAVAAEARQITIDDQRAQDPAVNMAEWAQLRQDLNAPQNSTRFAHQVGAPGTAAARNGVFVGGVAYRLYSIKTGVDYVGSKYEGPDGGGKHRLEANSVMAMMRSDLMVRFGNRDRTFGIQPEVLTISAPLQQHGQRDGMQVRDLSCMQPNLDYLPGQAIPFARASFDLGGDAVRQEAFWRDAFAVPLGRAKARLFLNYGLIHTSANAQNFVLGFSGSTVRQFVIRDVGDTSWHDLYIRYIMQGGPLNAARAVLDEESRSDMRHTLTTTGSGDYPPPYMVRLAAVSVLTHRFGENLGWNRRLQVHFATGVYDGFRAFVEEATGVNLRYPDVGAIIPQDQVADNVIMQDVGFHCRYPFLPFNPITESRYVQGVQRLLQLNANTLLARAAWVRHRGEQLMIAGRNPETTLKAVLNAEEAYLCAAVEKLVVQGNQNAIGQRISACANRGWPAIMT